MGKGPPYNAHVVFWLQEDSAECVPGVYIYIHIMYTCMCACMYILIVEP